MNSPLNLYIFPEEHPPIAIGMQNNGNMTAETTALHLIAGTRFLTLLQDANGSGGVSSLNVVGLAGDSAIDGNCMADKNNFVTSLPLPTETIATMSIIPDYTTTQVSRSTSAGRLVTVTATETFKGGRAVDGNNPINLTTVLAAALGAAAALAIAALVLYCKKKKRKGQNTRWDVSSNSSILADGSKPIHPGFFGKGRESRQRPGIELDTSFNGSRTNLVGLTTGGVQDHSTLSLNTRVQENPFHSHEDEIYDNVDFTSSSGNLNSPLPTAQAYDYDLRNQSQFSGPLASPSSPPVSPHIHQGKHGMRVGQGSTFRNEAIGSSATSFSREGGGGGGTVLTTASSHLRHRASPSNAQDVEIPQSHLRSRSNQIDMDPFDGRGGNGVERGGATTYVRHQDGGLLQDDRLEDGDEDEDDGTVVIDLPPQYQEVHPDGQVNFGRTRSQSQQLQRRESPTEDDADMWLPTRSGQNAF